MAALLPPSSRMLRPKRAATTGPTLRPIAVEPVALTSGTPSWATSARPHRAAAEHHLVEVGGHIHRGRGLLEQGVGGEGGEWGQLARLPDHRVAADEGEGGVPRPDRDREVERGDDGGGAERVPLLHQPVARPLAGDGQPVELAGEPDSEVTDVDHLLHLAERFALDLAGLEGDQAGEVGLVGAQCLTEAPDQFTALGGRGGAPGAEGGGGAVDGLIDGDGCIDPPE